MSGLLKSSDFTKVLTLGWKVLELDITTWRFQGQIKIKYSFSHWNVLKSYEKQTFFQKIFRTFFLKINPSLFFIY